MLKRQLAERRGFRIVTAMAVAFALIQAATAYLLPTHQPSTRYNEARLKHVPDLSESVIQWQTHNLFTCPAASDVLFFGDSSCLMGVIPKVVTDCTGKSAWNLGTIGYLTLEGHADLFELYARLHGTPKLAIYHATYYTWKMTEEERASLGFLLAFREWGVTNPLKSSWSDLSTWLPTNRANHLALSSLRRLFVSSEDTRQYLSKPRGVYPSDDDVRDQLRETRGFLPEVFTSTTREQWKEFARKFRSKVLPVLDPACVEPLQRMFRFAETNGIQLVVLMAPLCECFEGPDMEAAYYKLESDLRELTGPYARVRVESPLLRTVRFEDCATDTHLTLEGAKKNSRDLAERIVIPFFEKASFGR